MSGVRATTSIGDAERVLDFFNQSQIKQELHWFTHRDTIERAHNRDDRELFYVEADGGIVGSLMIWCESRVLEASDAQIRQIATIPKYRKQGVGRELCSTAEEFARKFDKEQMIADVAADSPATRFWEACGYQESKRWKTDSGREMVRVLKPLS